MTKIFSKPKKWPKYPQNLKNDQNTLENEKKKDQNTPETQKMTKIPSKPKNDQNTKETSKIIEIPQNLKITKILLNPRNLLK